MVENIEIIKNNCRDYAEGNKKAIEVLRKADGKNSYIEIARFVNIHKTKASGLLRSAQKAGLVTMIRPGIYKKVPGVLGYMPKTIKIKRREQKTVQELIKKIQRKRLKTQPAEGLSIPNKIELNLDKMKDAYGSLYATENTLRELIRKVLNKKPDWWKNNVSGDIQTKVEEAIKNQPYHAKKRNDEFEYTHLGQLKEIIISKKNWVEFLPHLNEKNKYTFSVTIDRAIASRNAIGHCIPLKAKDLAKVNMRFEDILEMIK